jgi:hypothetical protein
MDRDGINEYERRYRVLSRCSLWVAAILLPFAIVFAPALAISRIPDSGALYRMIVIAVISAIALSATALGLMAIIQRKRSVHRKISGAALAGIVLACVSIGLLVRYEYPNLELMRADNIRRMRVYNLHVLSEAMMRYCNDRSGRFPPAKTWNTALAPYVSKANKSMGSWCSDRKIWVSPIVADGELPTYAFNRRLDGHTIDDVQDYEHTVMIFESVPGNNVAGGPELLMSKSFCSYPYIAYADGHITACDTPVWGTVLRGEK